MSLITAYALGVLTPVAVVLVIAVVRVVREGKTSGQNSIAEMKENVVAVVKSEEEA